MVIVSLPTLKIRGFCTFAGTEIETKLIYNLSRILKKKVSQRTPSVCLISKRFFQTSEITEMNKIPWILCLLKFYQWVIFIGFLIRISWPLNSVGPGFLRRPPYIRSQTSNRLFEKCFFFDQNLTRGFFSSAEENHAPQSPMFDVLELCVFIR